MRALAGGQAIAVRSVEAEYVAELMEDGAGLWRTTALLKQMLLEVVWVARLLRNIDEVVPQCVTTLGSI